MATITVRDFRYDLPRVEALLRQREEIPITKRGKLLARLLPRQLECPPLPNSPLKIREFTEAQCWTSVEQT